MICYQIKRLFRNFIETMNKMVYRNEVGKGTFGSRVFANCDMRRDKDDKNRDF